MGFDYHSLRKCYWLSACCPYLQNAAADIDPGPHPSLLEAAAAQRPGVGLRGLPRTEAGGGERPLTRPQPGQGLPDVSLVLPVLEPRVQQLLPAGGHLDLPGAGQAARPVLEGDARVAQIRILKGENFEAGRRLGMRT